MYCNDSKIIGKVLLSGTPPVQVNEDVWDAIQNADVSLGSVNAPFTVEESGIITEGA